MRIVLDERGPPGGVTAAARSSFYHINRIFEPMVEACNCEIVTDEPAAMSGAYRVIVLRKVCP